MKNEYNGKESLVVGNGTKLSIDHIGSNVVACDYGNKLLRLHNMLHVPQIKRNLISIARLTTDNDVFLEFHSCFCLVKDKVSKKVMLRGTLKDGLYQFELPSIQIPQPKVSPNSPSAHVSTSNKPYDSSRSVEEVSGPLSQVDSSVSVFHVTQSNTSGVSKVLLHRRLGHASSPVINSVIKACSLQVSDNENEFFCDACQLGKSHRLSFPNSLTKAN